MDLDLILADAAATVAGISGVTPLNAVYQPPPDKLPDGGPFALVDLLSADVEMGGEELWTLSIQITIAYPYRGIAYSQAVGLLVPYPLAVVKAFRGNTELAGQAAILAGATVGKIGGYRYWTPDAPDIIAVPVTIQCQTGESVITEIAP